MKVMPLKLSGSLDLQSIGMVSSFFSTTSCSADFVGDTPIGLPAPLEINVSMSTSSFKVLPLKLSGNLNLQSIGMVSSFFSTTTCSCDFCVRGSIGLPVAQEIIMMRANSVTRAR